MQYLGLVLYAGVVCAAAVVLICRAGLMTPDTLPAVRWWTLLQLAGLLFGLALTLAAGPWLGGAAHAAGVLGALLLSSGRWCNGPPDDTIRSGTR